MRIFLYFNISFADERNKENEIKTSISALERTIQYAHILC